MMTNVRIIDQGGGRLYWCWRQAAKFTYVIPLNLQGYVHSILRNFNRLAKDNYLGEVNKLQVNEVLYWSNNLLGLILKAL